MPVPDNQLMILPALKMKVIPRATERANCHCNLPIKIPIPNVAKAVTPIALPIGPVSLVTILHNTVLIPSSVSPASDISGNTNIAAVKQNNRQICQALSEDSLKFNIIVTPKFNLSNNLIIVFNKIIKNNMPALIQKRKRKTLNQ